MLNLAVSILSLLLLIQIPLTQLFTLYLPLMAHQSFEFSFLLHELICSYSIKDWAVSLLLPPPSFEWINKGYPLFETW